MNKSNVDRKNAYDFSHHLESGQLTGTKMSVRNAAFKKFIKNRFADRLLTELWRG